MGYGFGDECRRWFYSTITMENKACILITGASSGMGGDGSAVFCGLSGDLERS